MSSMIVYGGMRFINDKTVPSPANFYGNSKWLGDVGVRKLGNEHFKVAVLRPPMIYGKDSRGNYPTLAKLARRLPIFPDVENKRSMLYIENLCEFVGLIILSGEGGIYFPQNAEYSTTSDLVKAIGNTAHSPVRLSKTLTPAVELAKKVPGKVKGLADKAFGSSYYDQRLSQYSGLDYQKVSLEESIKRTEGTGAETAFHFNSSDRRGGIDSIPRGQYEAAKVLKFSPVQTIQYIILPQVTKIVLPSVFNEIMALVKDTSLVYALGVTDLILVSRTAANRDASLAPMFVAGAIYLIMIGVVTLVSRKVEQKYAYDR